MKVIKYYFKHLYKNWVVALRCIVLAIFHFMHGILPFKFTEHEWYFKKQIEE